MPGMLNPSATDFSSGMSNLKISSPDFIPALDAIFNAATSQASLDGAVALCNDIAANPHTAHHVLEQLLPLVSKAASDKKSGTRRESAMIIYGAFYEGLLIKCPATEPLLVQQTLQPVFDGLADKGAVVRESSQYAIDAMFGLLRQPALVSGYLKALENYVKNPNAKFQGKVAALGCISKVAEKAIKAYDELGDVFIRDVMGREMEALIPVVENAMHDMKNDVSFSEVKGGALLTGIGRQSRC